MLRHTNQVENTRQVLFEIMKTPSIIVPSFILCARAYFDYMFGVLTFIWFHVFGSRRALLSQNP